MNFQFLLDSIVDWATTTGVKILVALILIFISFKIINLSARKIEKSAGRYNTDKTIIRTLAYLFKIGMKLIVALCLVSFVGIDASGLTALVASLGVGIGLAVNGALSNLAGGVLLIFTRPFRIDDFIEAQGHSGTVEDIHITNTRIRTPDNKIVYIPNGSLSSGSVVNYSVQDTRRIDVVFSVARISDFEKARQIIREICGSHPLVEKSPAPFIRMSDRIASSVFITTRVWVKNDDFWTVKFDLIESVKERFCKEGIAVPSGQTDVNIIT